MSVKPKMAAKRRGVVIRNLADVAAVRDGCTPATAADAQTLWLRFSECGAVDGRTRQVSTAAADAEAIANILVFATVKHASAFRAPPASVALTEDIY